MADILIMGELLVEIMRDEADGQLNEAGIFRGPYASGAPAICAGSAARLGSQVTLVGGVGEDDFGKCLLDKLKACNIDISHITVSKKVATGVAFNMNFHDGSRKFIYHMGNSAAVEAKSPDGVYEGLKDMHIMGCSLACKKEYAREIIKTMHKAYNAGASISFDPNIRKELLTDASFNDTIEEVLQHTSVFLPGKEELLLTMKEDSVERAIERCFTYPNLEMVLMKNGSKGSVFYKKGAEPQSYGVYKVIQKDATGSGDCFDGAFLAALTQNKPLDTACKWAAAAGALNAAAFGPMEGDISLDNVTKMIEG